MVSHLVSRILPSAWFAWCLVFVSGMDVGTLGNTLRGCVTQDPRVAPSKACAIHPTHHVCLIVFTSEP